jgi:rod shape-determining protein MreC
MEKLRKNRVVIWAAVIGLLFFLHYTRIISPLENLLINILMPSSRELYSGNSLEKYTADKWDQLEKDQLINLLQEQQEQINSLLAQNAKQEELARENEDLRQTLKFFSSRSYNFVSANVIYKENVFAKKDFDENIIIDKGSSAGLFLGSAVTDQTGVIIGKVVELKDNLAKVCLSINRDCKLAASVQNQARTVGIVQGDLALTLKMDFVPQSEVLNVGEVVVSSGLDPEIPSGLVIGRIIKTEKKSNEIWQEVSIEPLADFNNLKIVSVVLP